MPFGMPGVPSAPAVGTAPTDTGGLRTAAIVLFWCVAGASAVLTAAMFSRRATWHSDDVTFDDLQEADDFVGGAALILFGVAIAALIVVSIWSLRTARHARQTGASNVSPGLACGGWYIPLANLILPFIQLRRIAAHRGQRRDMISVWQGLLIAAWLLSGFASNVGNDIDTFDSFDDVSSTLTTQSVVGVFATVFLAATAFVAMRALKVVDAVDR